MLTLRWRTSFKGNFPWVVWHCLIWVREASVAGQISFLGDSCHWNMTFIRLVQDWELESVASLDLLYSGVLKGEGWIGYGVNLLLGGFLMLDLLIKFSNPLPNCRSLWRLCGIPKCLQRLTSLCGQRCWVELWPMTIWGTIDSCCYWLVLYV